VSAPRVWLEGIHGRPSVESTYWLGMDPDQRKSSLYSS
jgi:hypothetical protein